MSACRKVYIVHAHTYYQQDDARQAEAAETFRSHVVDTFAKDKRIQIGRLREDAFGPHPCGQFETAFTVEIAGQMLLWFQFNRPEALSVLVHPFTAQPVSYQLR